MMMRNHSVPTREHRLGMVGRMCICRGNDNVAALSINSAAHSTDLERGPRSHIDRCGEALTSATGVGQREVEVLHCREAAAGCDWICVLAWPGEMAGLRGERARPQGLPLYRYRCSTGTGTGTGTGSGTGAGPVLYGTSANPSTVVEGGRPPCCVRYTRSHRGLGIP